MAREPTKLFSAKHFTRIGVWNVWALYHNGKSQQLAKEMDIEVKWNISRMATLSSGHNTGYSSNTNKMIFMIKE